MSNDNQQNVIINVPADGSCLFWSAALAYLKPVINNNELFLQRYRTLFGSADHVNHIRNLIRNNNIDDIFIDSIRNRFRNRVVDYMRDHRSSFEGFMEGGISFESYLQNMRTSSTWGGEPEIRAITDMLDTSTTVTYDSNAEPRHYGRNNGVNINLHHTGPQGAKNHYNFALPRNLVNENDIKHLEGNLKIYNQKPQDFELMPLLIKEVYSNTVINENEFESFKARFSSSIEQFPSYLHSVNKPGFYTHLFLGGLTTVLDTEVGKKLGIDRIYFRFDGAKTLKVAFIKNGEIKSKKDVIEKVALLVISEEGSRSVTQNFDQGELRSVLGESYVHAESILNEIPVKLVEINKDINGIPVIEINNINVDTFHVSDNAHFREVEKGVWTNAESRIQDLAGSDPQKVSNAYRYILEKVAQNHLKYSDSLIYGSNAREAGHHGFLLGSLMMNFHYRHNLRIYPEHFAGRKMADLVMVARGPERKYDSIPIIVEIKAGTGTRSSLDSALDQAVEGAKGFERGPARTLTTNKYVLCAGVNFDLPVPISTIQSIDQSKTVAPFFHNMVRFSDEWNKKYINKNQLKTSVKNDLASIYHTFTALGESRDNHYFSRYLLGESIWIDSNFEKYLFLYRENVPTEMHTPSGRSQRPAAKKVREQMSQNLDDSHAVVTMLLISEDIDEPVYLLNIVESDRKDTLNKAVPLDRLRERIGAREIIELNLNFDTRHKSDFARHLTVKPSKYNSIDEYTSNNILFDGTFEKLPNTERLKESFYKSIDSQSSDLAYSSSREPYKNSLEIVSEKVLPFKSLITSEAHFQGLFHGVFGGYRDLRLQNSEEGILVVPEFQLGKGSRVDMLVLPVSLAQDRTYFPLGLELKISRQGKSTDRLLNKDTIDQMERYSVLPSFKALTDANKVELIGVLFNKGAIGSRDLILTSEKSVVATILHSSITGPDSAPISKISSDCPGGRRRKRNAGGGCLFSWDDIDKISVEEAQTRKIEEIKIDSNKFLTYSKNLNDREKSIQLTGFLQEKGLIDNVKGSNKYLFHQVVKDGSYDDYTKSLRIRELQSSLSSNSILKSNPTLKTRLFNAAGGIQLIRGVQGTVVQCSHGRGVDCGLSIGAIAWSFTAQPIEKVLVQVTPVVVESSSKLAGKLLPGALGTFTKYNIRIVGVKFRGTIAKGVTGGIAGVFDVIEIVRSSSNLIDCHNSPETCSAKTIRDNVASISFAGTSLVAGIALTALDMPVIGILVGLGIMVIGSVYSGISNIIEYEEKYDTTNGENWSIFWRTSVSMGLMDMSEDIRHLVSRTEIVNNITQEAWKSLTNSPDEIYAYAVTFGEDTVVPDLTKGYAKIIMNREDADTTRLSRIIPKPTTNATIICAPQLTQSIYEKEGTMKSLPTAIHHCENSAVIADDRRRQSGTTIAYNLVSTDRGEIIGSNKLNNHFLIFNGTNALTITGGNNVTNRFIPLRINFSGIMIGGNNNAINILDLSALEGERGPEIDVHDHNMVIKNTLGVSKYQGKVERIVGLRDKAETIDCKSNNEMFVDLGGGSQTVKDHIFNCKKVMIPPYTKFFSEKGENYVFYVEDRNYKGTDLHSHINLPVGTGTVVFPKSQLLSDCDQASYDNERNLLSLKLKLNQDSTYTIDIENFLDKEKNKPRFVLIDKNGNQIIPVIKESIQLIDEFVLNTEYDLEKSFDDVESYCNSVSSNKKDYKIFISVKDKNSDRIAQFGSPDGNVIHFDEKTVFAKGGDGGDIYIISDNTREEIEIDNSSNNSLIVNVTPERLINNNDNPYVSVKADVITNDEAIDVILIPEVSEEFLIQNGNLYLNYGDKSIKVKGYFQNEKYRHLIIMNNENKTFIPYIEQVGLEENRGRLLPIINPTPSQNVFTLPANSYEKDIVINCRKEDIKFYKDQNSLLLMRENSTPFILKIENFFSNERKINILLFNKGIFSTIELPREVEYYQNKTDADYNNIIKDYLVDLKSYMVEPIHINHNQHNDLRTLEKDDQRIGILTLKNIRPEQTSIETDPTQKDLIIRDKESSHSIVFRNWQKSYDYRISRIEFDLGDHKPIVINNFNRFNTSITDIKEIGALFSTASIKLNSSNSHVEGIENNIRCSLSVSGFEKQIQIYECLGFPSLNDQIVFTENTCAKEKIDHFKKEVSNSQKLLALIKLLPMFSEYRSDDKSEITVSDYLNAIKNMRDDLLLSGHNYTSQEECTKKLHSLFPELAVLNNTFSNAIKSEKDKNIRIKRSMGVNNIPTSSANSISSPINDFITWVRKSTANLFVPTDYLNEHTRRVAHDLCSKVENNFDEYKGKNVSKCEENIFNTAKSLPNPEEFMNVLSKDVNHRLEVNYACEKKYSSIERENALQNVNHRKEYLDSCRQDTTLDRQMVNNNIYFALSKAKLWDKAFSMVDGNIMLINLFLTLFQKTKDEKIVESKFEELSEYHKLYCDVLNRTKIKTEINNLIKNNNNVTINIAKEDLYDSNLVFSFLFGTEKEISDDLSIWLKDLIHSKELTEIKQVIDSRNFNELIKPIVKKIIRASENNKLIPKISRISLEFKKACGKIVKEIPQASISRDDIYDSYRLDFISLVTQGISAKEITSDLFKRADLLIRNRQSEEKGWFNKIKTVLLAVLPTSGGITEDNKRQEDLELLKTRVESIVSEAINSSMSSEVNNHMYSNNLSSMTNSNLKPVLSPFTLIREPSLISNATELLPSPMFNQISIEPVVNNTTMIS